MSTSVSQSKPATSSKSAGSGKKSNLRRWVIIIATLSLSLMVFFLVRTQGHVHGEEFAPSHFQSREFSFYEIPFLHIQITPIKRTGLAIAAANHIRQNLPKPLGAPEIWHLVTISRGLSRTTAADAQLLTEQLQMQQDTSVFWRKWSIDHPQHANLLWPIIQRLAERELYVLIPSVLDLAQKDLSPNDLNTRVDEFLLAQYKSLITDMREANRTELADMLWQEALTDFPDDDELRSLSSAETAAAGS